MKKANINEAVFEQMSFGVSWGEATFWETLLSQEGLSPFERRTVKSEIKVDRIRRCDYMVEEE